MIVFYHQMKILINFLCRWGLNPISLIQPLETLPVELTIKYMLLCCYFAINHVLLYCDLSQNSCCITLKYKPMYLFIVGILSFKF